jgi:hypothetical protein
MEVDKGPALIQGGDAQHVQGRSVESGSYVGHKMLAHGSPLVMENNLPADESTRTGISFVDQMAVNNPSPHFAPKEFHDSASSDKMSDSDESKSDSEDRINSPHPTKNLPVKSVPVTHPRPISRSTKPTMISPFLSVAWVARLSTSHLLTMMTLVVTYLFPTKAVDSSPSITLLRGPLMNYPLWMIPSSQVDKTKVSNRCHMCIHLLIYSRRG